MKIIVCYKWVLDEADLRTLADLSVETSRAKYKISDYDRNAIELAMRLAVPGDEVIALMYGNAQSQRSIKDALSRGPASACWVNDTSANTADGAVTARLLAAAIRKYEDVRLVVCAEGASDTYAHEVGPRLGVLLDWPVISYAASVSINENELTAVRKLETGTEIVRVTLPAVVTILPEAAPAPIPGLKMVLEASRKPVQQYSAVYLGLSAEELQPCLHPGRMNMYSMSRKNQVFTEGEPPEQIAKLVKILQDEGVLK
jgi:electron transfer flavoprotein beta subunit